MAFHWRDGLFFERLTGGTVRVFRQQPEQEAQEVALIPPSEWASIVASVSERGENGDTHREAERFHQEEMNDAE